MTHTEPRLNYIKHLWLIGCITMSDVSATPPPPLLLPPPTTPCGTAWILHSHHTVFPNAGQVIRSDSTKCNAVMQPSHIGGPDCGLRLSAGERREAAISASREEEAPDRFFGRRSRSHGETRRINSSESVSKSLYFTFKSEGFYSCPRHTMLFV